jgi:hypothetical protein
VESTASASEDQNRRDYARHSPIDRAAVWFNTGEAIGETCELKDISMTGFGIRCNEWQLPVFLGSEGRSLYCVLLLGEAHFGCMAHVTTTTSQYTGHIGLCFDAVPESSLRLLEGLIGYMAQRHQTIHALGAMAQEYASD